MPAPPPRMIAPTVLASVGLLLPLPLAGAAAAGAAAAAAMSLAGAGAAADLQGGQEWDMTWQGWGMAGSGEACCGTFDG